MINLGNADLMVPVVCSYLGSIVTPFLMCFEMSNAASDMAQEMNKDESASTRPIRALVVSKSRQVRRLGLPGHILE